MGGLIGQDTEKCYILFKYYTMSEIDVNEKWKEL